MKKYILVVSFVIVMFATVISGNSIFANAENIQNKKTMEQIVPPTNDGTIELQLSNEVEHMSVVEGNSLEDNQKSTEDSNNQIMEQGQTQDVNSRAIIPSVWGTSPVSFDEDTGILTVNPGVIAPRISSGYIDSANTIKKEAIKEIILENGVKAPANSNYLFSGNSSNYWFNNLTSIYGDLDISNVTNASYMFFHAEKLLSLDVSNWNTSKVTDMRFMFFSTGSLITLDVAEWNTSNVTTMQSMFGNGYSLISLDVSNWNTSEVVNMSNLFAFTISLINLDVSEWKTDKVTMMNGTFSGTERLSNLDVSEWDTSQVTSMYSMFSRTQSLTSLDVRNFNTSKVTDMQSMFSGSNVSILDVNNWDIGLVTNMEGMFRETVNLTRLNLSAWDTRNVTNIKNMFFNANLHELTLGEHSILNTTTALPAIKTASGAYSGKWERINPTFPYSVYNSSNDFMSNYDGSMAGTYVWQLASYTITYDLNGGTNNLSNPSEYTYSVGVSSFANPTKTGYTFLGWEDSSGNPITNISTTATGNKTLTATWEVSTYTITYDLDGGTNDLSNPSNYTYGIGVSSFANPTKTGYTFLEWVDESDNPITDISMTATGNKTLMAKWEANIYTIMYDLDGGTNALNNPSNYTYGVGVSSFANPTKTGYIFQGWVDESDNPITDISTTATGNKTLIAKWEEKRYEIITYFSAVANGSVNTITSTKIMISFSKDISTLSIEDINISNANIQVSNLIPLGSGVYEVAISGDWREGALVDISFNQGELPGRSLTDVIITPSTQIAILHKAKTDTGVTPPTPEKPANGSNNGDSNTLPQTGHNNLSMIMMLVAGLLISGGCLISRIKNKIKEY